MARQFVLEQSGQTSESEASVSYSEQLNEAQYEAVTAGAGPLLVVAGAGTGKTRTLLYRVAYLIEQGITPREILLLTFTRRAAREMLSRAATVLDNRCEQVEGGTFHSFCLRVLREFAPVVDYPKSFTVLDTADAAEVIDMLRTRAGYDQTEKRFPRKSTLQSIYSQAVNRQHSIREIVREDYSQFAVHLQPIEDLFESYGAYKRHHGLMDYDDLLRCTVELFRENEGVRQTVAARYRHVLVDEYQDTNSLQADLVDALNSVHGNLTVVGDDAQSIYGFRGANYRNILDFPEQFPGTQVVKLERNYRSTPSILEVANRVLDQAEEKYTKSLYTDDELEGMRPALVHAPDVRFQSKFVCQRIRELREEGVDLNRVGVLFRSGRDSYDLETELDRQDIPYVKYGGTKLTEAAHVKDLLAHLRIVENVQDEVAWNRTLQLIDGIGPKTARRIIEWALDTAQPFTFAREFTSDRYRERLAELGSVLQNLSEMEPALTEQLEMLRDYYRPLLEKRYAEDASSRIQDLEQLTALADNFASRSNFLGRLAIDPVDQSVVEQSGGSPDESPLVLTTIHSAKGLEFHAVFLINAMDGVIPFSYAMEDPDELDEELRLLYVALTRAEKELYVCYPMIRSGRKSGSYWTRPSRFLDRLPEDVLEPWTLVEEEPNGPSTDGETTTDIVAE